MISSLFEPLLARRSLENPAISLADTDAWAHAGYESIAGQKVGPKQATSVAALWSAIMQISGDVSKLPLGSMRKNPPNKPLPDESFYLHDLINPLGQANPQLPALKLWRRVMVHALMFGNGVIWADWQTGTNGQPRVAGLYNLLPDRTAIYQDPAGRLFVITEVGDRGQVKALAYDECVHIEGLCLDNLAAEDTLHAAREDLGQALAARHFTSKFLKHNMTAGGILQVPPGASPKAREKVENAIAEREAGGDKAFKTLILRDNFKWHGTQVDPQSGQLVEVDEAKIRDIARRFLLSPARLGVSESVSYNSLEAERRSYHETTLSYWLSEIRAELNLKLLLPAQRRRWLLDYNVNLALLWADAQTLATIAVQGIHAVDPAGRPLFQVNEARSWFNLPPYDDPPADSAGSTDEVRQALAAVVAAELTRAVRRLNTHAGRAAKRGPEMWATWQGQLREHGQVIGESLAAPLAACRAAGYLPAALTPAAAADALLSLYGAECAAIAAAPAAGLRAAAESRLTTFERQRPAALAASWTGAPDDET